MGETSSLPQVVLLSRDLFFASRIEGVCQRLNAELISVPRVEDLPSRMAGGKVAGILVDLTLPGLEMEAVIAALPEENRPRVAAFGPHVAERQLAAAREAGCDEVLPRSRFSAQMAEVVGRMLGRTS